jgi:sulfatase modifying factor 1
VRCQNDLGERSEVVVVPELELARAWLSAPASVGRPAGSRASASTGYALRLVPAGTWPVGCTVGQGGDCGDDERPARRVNLSRAVLVGETEVTQGLYERLVGTNPSVFGGCGATCPVENVSWLEAVRFANLLSASEGFERCYVISGENVTWPKGLSCQGYRLPTEAEWEVAARGGRDDKYAGGDDLGTVGWYSSNSGGETHPVGQLAANGYGLYDMSGNVWEWTWDWFNSGTYVVGRTADPIGPAAGSFRVIRGGSWSHDAQRGRVANRYSITPGRRDSGLGFRLVRTAT